MNKTSKTERSALAVVALGLVGLVGLVAYATMRPAPVEPAAVIGTEASCLHYDAKGVCGMWASLPVVR